MCGSVDVGWEWQFRTCSAQARNRMASVNFHVQIPSPGGTHALVSQESTIQYDFPDICTVSENSSLPEMEMQENEKH